MKKISILIPVYNEKDFLLEVINRIESVNFGLEKEIILIDDFSTDGTRELYPSLPYKVLYNEKNMGKGASLKRGIAEATGGIIIIQDADLEYNPEDYKALVELIKEDKADVVYGSRLSNPRAGRNFLFFSFIANKTLTFLTQILYKTTLTDMETCYKAFKADILKSIDIKAKRFEFEPEITAKLLKKKVRFQELPISYNARYVHQGKKITWKDGIEAICTLFKYKFFV